MDKLIVVDYQEGAGGEFIARFISAHLGHKLAFDQQAHPSHVQKWLNSHSLVNTDWDQRFSVYLRMFFSVCKMQNATKLAVPYHLYKWPGHVDLILQESPNTRFVKINCNNYVDQVSVDFQRKVIDRPIQDFSEMQFLLKNKSTDLIKSNIELYKQGQLTYKDIFPKTSLRLQTLPSKDIEIDYGDFFCNFKQTAHAYEKLCNDLNLNPNLVLLSSLLERNKKNQQDLNNHLSKA